MSITLGHQEPLKCSLVASSKGYECCQVVIIWVDLGSDTYSVHQWFSRSLEE